MCGRTFCAIDPHCLQKACRYIDPSTGRHITPEWRDAPTGETYKPSYNIGPTIFTPVLMSSAHVNDADIKSSRIIQPMRWGLIPPWHKGGRSSFKSMHNNCRGETISEKNTFSVPFNKGRRCVVITEGFYEWKTEGKKKYPLLFTMKSDSVTLSKSEDLTSKSDPIKDEPDDKRKLEAPELPNKLVPESIKKEKFDSCDVVETAIQIETVANVKSEELDHDLKGGKTGDIIPQNETDNGNCSENRPGIYTRQENGQKSELVFMAGIFDVCKEEGGMLFSYSVLTTSAVGAVEKIHHRMPVILQTQQDVERWLNCKDYPSSKVKDLIVPRDCLTSHRVTDKVNNVRYQEADCIIEHSTADIKPQVLVKGDLRNWFTKKEPLVSAAVKRKSDARETTHQDKKAK